ncbi:diguanylate cyclase/phosphodiesterase (GGDEF & EAL domain) with PAS/PAC sensor(s) [Candidatus Burkholderia verschuerenii]|uniref:Diguanylate cyclase/phosphodiesterase (GGDEF & EAL domain) with PAS/PAC sensor(S) n=1 Tax=Candidatus Burkholderia verschuerenii TaxID=242163 RepID=A0A0L0MB44_9BURK|nr:sensor domain-containing diguanylate cyclase [Candidatus Burkholderia verschuerenii]KND59491.1 diguanylate cyclase/phosphodiesterase (GGDEF & EAL domain) with PAS/PAC sensor(s) [Candidatus Burkholderia verschuerenii]
MEFMLERLSESVASADSLEKLARPLLEMLEIVTGLESVYLTSIDETAGIQSVDYARNSGELRIDEGLEVPWSDTLCKRCIEEGRRFTSNISEIWADSQAAKALGIETYASAPVCASNGSIIGTLCAASKRSKSIGPRARSALNLFSKIIAQHIERERLLGEVRRSNEYLAKFALTDALTGLPNRRALQDELGRLLARAGRDGSYVIVGMIDLDDFKRVNDKYGHVVGDALLKNCAQRIAGVTRDTDMLARIGGDEFAFVGPGLTDFDATNRAAEQIRARIMDCVSGSFVSEHDEVKYCGLSVGAVAVCFVTMDQAIALADTAMYETKRERKKLAAQSN